MVNMTYVLRNLPKHTTCCLSRECLSTLQGEKMHGKLNSASRAVALPDSWPGSESSSSGAGHRQIPFYCWQTGLHSQGPPSTSKAHREVNSGLWTRLRSDCSLPLFGKHSQPLLTASRLRWVRTSLGMAVHVHGSLAPCAPSSVVLGSGGQAWLCCSVT